MAKSSLSNSLMDKSWVDMCDDDFCSESSDDENKVIVSKSEDDKTKNDTGKKVKTPVKVISPKKEIKTEKQDEKEESSPWRFSYATILKNSASKTNIEESKTPTKQDKIKTEPAESKDNGSVKGVKREIQREFLQEDLSLSSHLDVFHMQSPIKLEPLEEDMGSPSKRSRRKGPNSNNWPTTPSKLSLSEDAVMPDDVLMPSPKKVTRLSSRRKREPGESPLTRKRSKNSPGYRNTPRCVVPVEQPTLELETDEQVLVRRQKQIDYGKNTIGYENYLQMVPRHKRHKRHPMTPPKHIKYSRRAWDGLIRQWRQQLHFWDPPSQGGGNIDDLDLSSMSEASSDAGSQTSSCPATPRDQYKPRRATRKSNSNRTSESSSLAEDSGCSPLKEI